MGQRLARVCNRLSFPGASIPVYSVTLLCAPPCLPLFLIGRLPSLG
jgi:hypothetical protein